MRFPSSLLAVTFLLPGVFLGCPTLGRAQYRVVPPIYGYVNPYGVYQDPTSGYLQGAAQVIQSQGQFQISTQQANLIRQRAEQAKIETRRRMFDEMRYEQANTPSREELRHWQMQQNLMRSLNNPPVNEIWSGTALNVLLQAIEKGLPQTSQGAPQVPIDDGTVRRINITAARNESSPCMLRRGPLAWPVILTQDRFAPGCKLIDQLVSQVVEQVAKQGRANSRDLAELLKQVDALRAQLKEAVAEVSPPDYVRAKRFINQVDNAVHALEDPNVANYFNGTWELKGGSVDGVIDFMSHQGLRFAAATEGDEPAYTAFHQAMVQVFATAQMVARPGPGVAGQPQ